MEKIKELVDIRFQIIKQFKKEIIQLQNEDNSFADNSNIQRKILKFIINAKKEEKQRINIENKLLEILFNQRADSQLFLLQISQLIDYLITSYHNGQYISYNQRQFYQTSISIMNCLHQYFKLETETIFNKEPNYFDIATLYVEFFEQTNNLQKVDEIKMIIKNQLYEKELVEMMRRQFDEFIQQNSNTQLKQLKTNRNKSSQKDIQSLLQNLDTNETQRLSANSQINDSQRQTIRETLQNENRRSKIYTYKIFKSEHKINQLKLSQGRRSNRISVSTLESRQTEFKTDIDLKQNNKKQNNTLKNTLSNFQSSNIEIQIQSQQKNGQNQFNNSTIYKNKSNQSVYNSLSNLNIPTNCSSTKNISNNSNAKQNINTTLQNINPIQNNISQNQQNIYQIQYNLNDKKKLSPQKRFSIINNMSNDILDLETNNSCLEIFNFLLKKLILHDGSISDQGYQQLLNYMISKNQQIKSTHEEYYNKYNEKYPYILQNQQHLINNNFDRFSKRKKNQDILLQKNQTNTTRPLTSYGNVCQNQSLNQIFLKIDKKQYLSNTKEQFYVTNNSQQITIDFQNRPFSRQKYNQDQNNTLPVKSKVKHLSLEQNRRSFNISDTINQNEMNLNSQNKAILTTQLTNEDTSQERQVQNLTKQSQDQFVQRMRSSHKIYYLSRKSNANNQLNLYSQQNQAQLKMFESNQMVQGRSNSILKVTSNQIVINTNPQIEANEKPYTTVYLTTQENDQQQNFVSILDKSEFQDNNQTLTTQISSHRNQQQNLLIVPNPQYQYFYSSCVKQQQPNNFKSNSSIDSGSRPKTASVNETLNSKNNGQKGKMSYQIQQQANRKYRSRSINQSKNYQLNQNNWINTQTSDQSTANCNTQYSQGDLMKYNTDISFQGNSLNQTSFYGTQQNRNNQIQSQMNQQICSNTLPIQNQIFQLNNYQQFRVSSAKKNNHPQSLENVVSIKEKYYYSTKDKRRISQSYNQTQQAKLQIKEKSFLPTSSHNEQHNPQKQFIHIKQAVQESTINKTNDNTTDMEDNMKYVQVIDDNTLTKSTIQNNNQIRIYDNSINYDKDFNNTKTNQFRLYTPYSVSNLMNQDVMSNAIQSAMQQKLIPQEQDNQGHIKTSQIRINSKKR